MTWFVYIILCSDTSLYTGITNDVQRRFEQHADGRGAKYFYGRRPERLVYLETGHDRSSATRRELRLKKLSRRQKTRLIASEANRLDDFLHLLSGVPT
ncbi:GIY-YIG nuclease family protein [Candidatus Methylomicrobium oryzae]|jgi:putative endonuclease|uniref:GIY-YIG nuclease family protein n=1 Tax=Candidatus Methylomicrobium oryzae TaxID=2802053 RepID=UPI0019220AC6|nr:GIY-YIG nuclease family protein [Methylomicrobium sp. RS1]MBL1264643.1 GIY-YIG nuclease family protein [Methylomicrobium sp. RS1]